MKQKAKAYLLLFIVLGIGKLFSQQQTEHKDSLLVLKNGLIIHLTPNGSNVKKGTIIIEKGKIKQIDYSNDTIVFHKAKIIDLNQKYVLPGLIDTHVHLATAPKKTRKENNSLMKKQLERMFFSGITTVRDMAGNAVILADYKRASELHQISSPSIFYASMFAGPKYLNEVRSYPGSQTDVDTPWEQTITKKTNIQLAVAQAKGSGATGIKIYADLSALLINKIVKEANKQGLMTWSHSAVFPASPNQVINAKVNTMSHASDIMYGLNTNDTITRGNLAENINYNSLNKLLLKMKKNNIILDATNYIAEQNDMVNSVKITKQARKLGVKVSVGTDWPYLYESEAPFFKEIKLLINKSGFSTTEALYAATKIGAESIGLYDRGMIEKGKRADILIINKNPLENIENLKSTFMVIKSGIVHKNK